MSHGCHNAVLPAVGCIAIIGHPHVISLHMRIRCCQMSITYSHKQAHIPCQLQWHFACSSPFPVPLARESSDYGHCIVADMTATMHSHNLGLLLPRTQEKDLIRECACRGTAFAAAVLACNKFAHTVDRCCSWNNICWYSACLYHISLDHTDETDVACSSGLFAQAKHQPLQFLNVSTLREYLRFEFLDLVGEALEPPPASDSPACDPWHQEEDLPELAPEDNDRDTGPEGNADGPVLEGSDDADATGPHAVSSDVQESNHPISASAQPSIPDIAQRVSRAEANAHRQFDFEPVLQDFVLLTFLVRLSIPLPSKPPPPPPPPPHNPFSEPAVYVPAHGAACSVWRARSGCDMGIEAMTHPSLTLAFAVG